MILLFALVYLIPSVFLFSFPECTLDGFVFRETLSEGQRSTIIRIQQSTLTEHKFLILKQPKTLNQTKSDVASLQVENFNYLYLDHPSIIKPYCSNSGRINSDHTVPHFIVLPYYFEGTLSNRKYVDEKLKRLWMAQILSATHYIHSKGIAHRDLKPDNILVSGKKVVIIDFSLGLLLEEYKHYAVGTTKFRSPEMDDCYEHSVLFEVIECDYDYSTDYYSIGVILLELYVHFKDPPCFVWYDSSTLDTGLRSFGSLTGDVIDLLSCLLAPKKDDRKYHLDKEFERLKAMKYFEGIDWNNILESTPIISMELAKPKKFPNYSENTEVSRMSKNACHYTTSLEFALIPDPSVFITDIQTMDCLNLMDISVFKDMTEVQMAKLTSGFFGGFFRYSDLSDKAWSGIEWSNVHEKDIKRASLFIATRVDIHLKLKEKGLLMHAITAESMPLLTTDTCKLIDDLNAVTTFALDHLTVSCMKGLSHGLWNSIQDGNLLAMNPKAFSVWSRNQANNLKNWSALTTAQVFYMRSIEDGDSPCHAGPLSINEFTNEKTRKLWIVRCKLSRSYIPVIFKTTLFFVFLWSLVSFFRGKAVSVNNKIKLE